MSRTSHVFAWYLDFAAATTAARDASAPHDGSAGCSVCIFDRGGVCYGLRDWPLYSHDTVAVFSRGVEEQLTHEQLRAMMDMEPDNTTTDPEHHRAGYDDVLPDRSDVP